MLTAATVEQAGVVRAPMGSIVLGGTDSNSVLASRVSLLPGSLTSTSGAGLSLPYGGTLDGIQWRLDGAVVEPRNVGGGALPIGVRLVSSETDVAPGAVLDMSGGGELTGAAFVSGRGGSVDILRHALADANPRYGFSQPGNEVYAIVPGYAGSAAPLGLSDGSADPAVGQQVVVPAGVPGLAAGTYTLLPASFALQPGAYRVELGASGATGATTALATGTGSWRVAGHRADALGGAVSPLLTDLLLTPAATVRRHSGYNETSYNAFVTASAQRLGLPRGWQTVDAGTLRLELGAGAGRQGPLHCASRVRHASSPPLAVAGSAAAWRLHGSARWARWRSSRRVATLAQTRRGDHRSRCAQCAATFAVGHQCTPALGRTIRHRCHGHWPGRGGAQWRRAARAGSPDWCG